jgi:hypothetical protein
MSTRWNTPVKIRCGVGSTMTLINPSLPNRRGARTGLAMTRGLFFLVGRFPFWSGPIECDVRCYLRRALSDRDLQEDPKWKISD